MTLGTTDTTLGTMALITEVTTADTMGDITAVSTPEEVLGQEELISEALNRVVMMAERYPELKADANYFLCMDAADGYKKMVQTSSLIYNDSVARLNKTIGRLPNALIAYLLGFHRRKYLNFQ